MMDGQTDAFPWSLSESDCWACAHVGLDFFIAPFPYPWCQLCIPNNFRVSSVPRPSLFVTQCRKFCCCVKLLLPFCHSSGTSSTSHPQNDFTYQYLCYRNTVYGTFHRRVFVPETSWLLGLSLFRDLLFPKSYVVIERLFDWRIDLLMFLSLCLTPTQYDIW